MKKLQNILLFCALSGVLFACSSKSHKHDEAEHDHHSEMNEGSMETAESEGSIGSAYLELKNALVETDANAAQEAAKQLEAAFTENELPSEAELAKKISQTDDVEEQRTIFKIVSEQMYELASEQKFEFTTLYKQYCPMAFNNTGAYWLSDSKEIMNPYFGDKMLKCGKVEETLAKK